LFKPYNLPMEPQSDLKILLHTMQPVLQDDQFVIYQLNSQGFPVLPFEPVGLFNEKEGWTVYARKTDTDATNIAIQQTWACITLMVFSSLEAVGFLAEITHQLAASNIPVNAISAYNHDHLFVPWSMKDFAMQILKSISDSST